MGDNKIVRDLLTFINAYMSINLPSIYKKDHLK